MAKLVKKHGLPVNIICVPPPNLSKILVRARYFDKNPCCYPGTCLICNENEGKCLWEGCVYLITCCCGDRYVGETGRPLFKRIQEHQRSLINYKSCYYWDKPLAKHRRSNHNNSEVSIKIDIIGVRKDPFLRKLLEAKTIRGLCPELNCREELVDFAPYL